MKNYRKINAFLLFMAVTAMVVAYYYFQKHLELEPCPLCIFQRVGMIVMGVFSAIAFLFNPKSFAVKILLWLASFAGVVWGMVVAGRHVWLQHLPADEVPACGPGLNYWLDVLPFTQVMQEVFKGSGECAVIDWQLLGLSISEYTLITFVFLAVVHLVLLLAIFKSRSNWLA